MATPKGVRCLPVELSTGDKCYIYSDATLKDRIIVQLRRNVPTEQDIMESSFKVSVAMTPKEALALAAELYAFASAHAFELKATA